ncbi:hypothetical protein [Jiella sonneratiae]|uniref:DUF680 domain-containing protein n=1 Tax=Jiella sonneratiae TaxID=2816856 RepID=A0ABS3JAZ0_9HYPH|nr:hypothetical protein [Jiella sonneratiae]MBO0906325.1 hypothetical protein [Jiella sonneratiae]
MKAFLASTAAAGLVLAAASGAFACNFKSNVSAEAPMTPIVTADQKTDAPPPKLPAGEEKKG